MPPTTNFKTYEAQARLLAALIASLDDKRLDYKKIAQCFGGGATHAAIEHRFRPIKLQAEFIRSLLDAGGDPGDYAIWDIKTKDKIQQHFGSSTPDGIAFQFRAVKQGANVLKNAVEKGNDPVSAFSDYIGGNGSSVPATPTHHAPGSAKRGRTTKTAVSGGGTPASKRRKAVQIKPEPDFDDTDSPEVDYDELDQSPTRNVTKVKRTPRKNPQELVPRSAWAKPVPGSATGAGAATPRSGPAPVTPVPTTSSYSGAAPSTSAASTSTFNQGTAHSPHPAMNYFPFTGTSTAAATAATLNTIPAPAAAPYATLHSNNNNSVTGMHHHQQHHYIYGTTLPTTDINILNTPYYTGTGINTNTPSFIDMTTASSSPSADTPTNNTTNNYLNYASNNESTSASASEAPTPQATNMPMSMSMSMSSAPAAGMHSFKTEESFFSTETAHLGGGGGSSENDVAAGSFGFTDEEEALYAGDVDFNVDAEWDAGDC
ncbi:hypothetical protein MFIFM68171_04405 [Madurella fahalii]|uniref:Uncharacterized protein n=1 Tax=Madurella fahalii TaxID=1157608 RepID=A0ABQ0G8U6_9PEZI